MERLKSIALNIYNKDIIELESELQHNSFYSESEKRIIGTFIGSLDSREIGNNELQKASDLACELSKLSEEDSNRQEEYLQRSQTLLKRKKKD